MMIITSRHSVVHPTRSLTRAPPPPPRRQRVLFQQVRQPMHSNWVSTTSIMPSQPRPQPPSASVTASSTFTPSMWDEERKVALLKLARVHNLVPSILLVFLGAWAGTGRTFACFGSALASLSVWVMSLVSGGVAIASVIVNDYFDWSSGIDQQNSPDKPLPSGIIQPDLALLLSLSLYAGVLISACLLEPRTVRIIVAWSAALTLLYTPLLKKMTGVKNIVVAAIIAASPLSGALAAGAAPSALAAVVATCVWAFLGVLHREVLMDITDVDGDASAGVLTMPVVLGRPAALAFATGCVAVASVYGLYLAVKGAGLAWLWTTYPAISQWVVRSLATVAVASVASQLLQGCVQVYRSNYDETVTGGVIDGSLLPIGVGMLLMATLA